MPLRAVSPGTQLWAKRYNGPHGEAQATSVAVSPNGSTVFVTGYSLGSFGLDYGTVAYNATTGAQVWAKRYNNPSNGNDQAYSVTVSPSGSTVFVTGFSSVSSTDGRFTTIAYNAATGAQQWLKQYKAGEPAYSVAVSPDGGKVFVTGYSNGGAATSADYTTVAYNAATGAQLWVAKYNDPINGIDQAKSVTVSPTGTEVFVTGFSEGTPSNGFVTIAYNAATGAQLWLKKYNSFGSANCVTVSPNGKEVFVTGLDSGYATVAYNAATGAQLWAKKYNLGGGGQSYSVAVSPSGGTVFVTGTNAGASTPTGYATVAYNATTGAQLWAKKYGPGDGALAYAVAVSPSGTTVYVTGESNTSKTGSAYGYATIAYNAKTGAQLWVKRYSGPTAGDPFSIQNAIAVSPTTGTVFVTGTNNTSYATVAYSG
jgi:DNA-binding beta-propeller fold protein YncE